MGTVLHMIRISRTQLRCLAPSVNDWTRMPCRCVCSSASEKRPSMLRHLTSKITATGPITVAEYMREVLTNPVSGYYVKNDMLGADGDFITSPEISQIFGELIGIWCVSEWMAAGKPKTLQLVELGPGRGSLISDILRVFHQLQSALCGSSVSVHLVEVSPKLSEVQARSLITTHTEMSVSDEESVYRTGTTHPGIPVSWYRRLEDVPRGFSIFLAHEFFDALPIHKFQRTQKGWREVMVDTDLDDPGKLRFVVFPAPTLASSTLIHPDEPREHVEVCADGGVVVQKLTGRITEDGGAALIVDYGHDGTKTDTFRGFKEHKLHDVLVAPGTADLTADVDFSYLRRMAGDAVVCFGPIPQRTFLKNMGIDTRLQVLLRRCSDASSRSHLIHGYKMLTDPEKMGHRFQFFSLLAPSRLYREEEEARKITRGRTRPAAPLPVAGFTELGLD